MNAARRRATLAATATALATSTLVLASTPVVATATSPTVHQERSGHGSPRAHKWSGSRIHAGHNAAGEWIGGYRVRTTPAFRTQPGKAARASNRTRFKQARWVGKVGNSKRRTRQAAWVLSKYGDERNRTQAAAVDATVLHLLRGGTWKINKRAGSRRINQAPYASYVRSYARQMLQQARQQSGRIAVRVSATTAAAGSASKVTATVTSKRTGKPVRGVRVQFQLDGSTRAIEYTNRAGQAVAALSASTGTNRVTARALGLPAWKIRLRPARRTKASDVALAGATMTARGHATLRVVGRQYLSIRSAAAKVTLGNPLGGTWTITGGAGERTAAFQVFGPYTDTARCQEPAAFATTATINQASNAGTLPRYVPKQSGYYRWQLSAGANAVSDPETLCGPVVQVQARATLGQRPSQMTEVALGQTIGVTVHVTGFDRVETGHRLTSRLYGPYSTAGKAACGDKKLLGGKTVAKTIKTNGTYAMSKAQVAEPGWYGWRTTLSDGNFVLGRTTGCGAKVKVIKR